MVIEWLGGEKMTAEQALNIYRQAFLKNGLEGVRKAKIDQLEGLDELLPGLHYEALAWDALRLEHPGWSYVCLRAAAEHCADEGRSAEVQRLLAAADTVLASSFPPYDFDGAVLREVREWASIRVDERAQKTPPSTVATDLKHRWMFRLVRTQQMERPLRIEELAGCLGLGPLDKILLWTLAGLPGGAVPLALGELVELIRDEGEGRIPYFERFDPRAPLMQWELVHLTTN